MDRLAKLFCFLLPLLVAFPGCPKDGTATVTCGKLEKFKGDIGNLNSANFSLGTIIVLNTKDKSGYYLTSASIPEASKNASPTVASIDEEFAASLTVSTSANVPQALQADIETQLSRDTSVTATNVKRVSVNDVASVVDAVTSAKKSVKDALTKNDPNVLVAIVSTVSYADKTVLALKNSSETTAGVKVVTYGEYKLKVTYSCSDKIDRSGNQFGAFFKGTALAYDKATDRIVAADVQNLDFSGYDLGNALAVH